MIAGPVRDVAGTVQRDRPVGGRGCVPRPGSAFHVGGTQVSAAVLKGALLIAVCVLLSGTPLPAAPDPEPPPTPLSPESPPPVVSAARLNELVADLDSSEFAARQSASRELATYGRQAVTPLIEAARSGSLEVAIRAIRVLEEIYVSGDETTIDETEAALDTLAESGNKSIAGRARTVLTLNYDVRERRAVSQITEMGGIVRYADNVLVNPNNPNGPQTRIAYVLLGLKWTGGDEGLSQVKRLSNLRTLYLIKGAPISKDALAEVEKALPNLTIQNRGRAFLGIGGLTHVNGCQVIDVKPNSAAADAGMRPGDVITHFNDKQVESFEALISLIAETGPGDKIPAKIIRSGVPQQIEIKMGAWSR